MGKDLPVQSDTNMSVSCPCLGRKALELLSLTHSCRGLRNRIMHVFTDGASESLGDRVFADLEPKKPQNLTFVSFSLPDAAS